MGRCTKCCAAIEFATAQTCREVRRTKCTYCLGVSSVLFVVLLAGVAQSLLEKAPLIFLRQAENTHGQVDIEMTTLASLDRLFMNYTAVADRIAMLATAEEYKYHAPRYALKTSAYNNASCVVPSAVPASATGNAWMYYPSDNVSATFPPGKTMCNGACLFYTCAEPVTSTLVLFDSNKESAMGYGREWNFPRVPRGKAYIHEGLANQLGVAVGDSINLDVALPFTLRYAFASEDSEQHGWAQATSRHSTIALPVTVDRILPENYGKYSDDDESTVFMEYGSFVQYASEYLHPAIRYEPDATEPAARANPDGDLYQYAAVVAFNLPPSDRINIYSQSNYDDIQIEVAGFTSRLMYGVGFTETTTVVPILEELEGQRFTQLYLGLVLDILLIILFALSTMLIYSLLLIKVESRTFELAVRRMLGASRKRIMSLVLAQAIAFAIPAWVIGLSLAAVFTSVLSNQFASLSGVDVDSSLTPAAIGISTLLATAIPLLACIGPIRTALASTLRDALDIKRPKTAAVKFTLERSEDQLVSWNMIILGMCLFVFGFGIYYLMPLSLLSLNLSLFFNIFFFILLGMLLGLVLLAINLEVPLEQLLIAVCLFFDRAVLRRLTFANLIAHRLRNRKTMIMYSLSIAFIVFITVAATQQIQSAQYRVEQRSGSRIFIEINDNADTAILPEVEARLLSLQSAGTIESYSWVTQSLSVFLANYGVSEMLASNLGHYGDTDVKIFGISPNFFDTAFEDYVDIDEADFTTGLSLAEELYTVRGSQEILVSAGVANRANLEYEKPLVVESDGSAPTRRLSHRTGTILNLCPGFEFSRFNGGHEDVLVSIPSYLRILRDNNVTIGAEELKWSRVFIKPAEGSDENAITGTLDEVLAEVAGWDVSDVTSRLANLDVATLVLNFIFAVLTAVAMFLCFFSLLSSMVTNIHEQKQEIGVLLAIGVRGSHMRRVYSYEAFILVLASSIMGTIIGTVIAWTFGQQSSLFTDLPVPYVFPYITVILIVLVSIVCAILAAYLPTKRLTKKNSITGLIRSF